MPTDSLASVALRYGIKVCLFCAALGPNALIFMGAMLMDHG